MDCRLVVSRATVNGGNGNGNGNGKGSSKLPATRKFMVGMAIGHNVKMPDLPNHKFPNPTHYVQVHLKSTTLTFSALTRYTDAGLFFFVTFILFNYAHACLL